MLILFIRTEALDEGTSLEMLPERLRTEIAIHVHLDTLRKVRFSIWLLIFTGNSQLLDKVKVNMIILWRDDQLFSQADGWGK